MIVEAEEPRVRKCLRHDDGRGAMAATDIGYAGASFELGLNPVERRHPLRDQMPGVPRPAKALGAAEQSGVVLVPADAPTRPERLRELRPVEDNASDDVEGAGKKNRA